MCEPHWQQLAAEALSCDLEADRARVEAARLRTKADRLRVEADRALDIDFRRGEDCAA